MKTGPTSLERARIRRNKLNASALIIVLCFVVLLTVVVLAVFSRSIFNGLISGASTNVTKSDLYAHGAINQIIGDLEQEIVGGSSVTSTTGGNIYRPNGTTNMVPYPAGPYAYGSSAWTSLPNVVKESYHGVAFYPNSASFGYDANGPTRASAVSTTSSSVDGTSSIASGSVSGTSRNGRYVSVSRWNKPLLLPKASATFAGGTGGTALSITSDTGTSTQPVSTFIAPDWILTAADGSNVTSSTLDTSSSATTSNVNQKSPKYVVGRYAYTIYNEGGLLDANVAGISSSGSTATQKALISRKGPAAFADLTQLPGITSLAAARQPQVVSSLVGWRNSATVQSQSGGLISPNFPLYAFNSTALANYLNYLLGISNNFMSTGNTALDTGLSDRVFTNRQQMINFFESTVAKNATEQAYLQDAMMYLGTFSRTLNQPSYWPDPSRPSETNVNIAGTATVWPPTSWSSVAFPAYNGWNDAPGAGSGTADNEDVYNPALRSKRVTTAFNRPDGISTLDGTAAKVGDPLIKKRFPLSRLMWITYAGPSANIPTTDPLFLAYQQFYTGSSSGTPPSWLTQLWSEGTAANIQAYFGLSWGADPLNASNDAPLIGRGGNCWTYLHGVTSGGSTLIGKLSDVQPLGREPDFFELLQAGVKIGGIAMPSVWIGNGENTGAYFQNRDSQPIFQILQLGANIIDEANPTQFPTHIEFNANIKGTAVVESLYGAMDLPYLYSYKNVAFINTAGSSGTASGKLVGLVVPIIWNPYDINGPSAATYSVPLSSSLYPSKLRITAVSIPLPQPASTAYPWVISAADATPSSEPSGDVNDAIWATEDQTSLTFNNPTPATSSPSSLYREPVALDQLSVPGGLSNSGLALGSASNLIAAAGFSAAVGVPEAGSGHNFVGFLIGTATQYWPAGGPVTSFGNILNPTFGITIRMEYQDPANTGIWKPYQEYYLNGDQAVLSVPAVENGTTTNPYFYGSTSALSYWARTASSSWWPSRVLFDPRTNRWATPQAINMGGFTDATGTTTQGAQPTTAAGANVGQGAASGWTPATTGASAGQMTPGLVALNINNSAMMHYNDPDAVIRRAMAAYVPVAGGVATTTVGLPLASTASILGSFINPAYAPIGNPQSQSRPIILHRPYRSVAELGYVFSDTPFRNIDFFTPESSYSALLDMFCINEDYRPDAVAAGRVDLNTKQAPVLQALLMAGTSGAYRDEENPTTPTTGQLTTAEAVAISQGLVKRTTVGGTNPNIATLTTPQPLSNIADLVGRWLPGSTATTTINSINAYDGSVCYDGFSADLGSLYSSGTASYSILQRFREATMRALSDAGQAGTWNLLIDVVAQSGRYPSGASGLSDFLVEGERRFWVHVAIDRQTGQVIDENIEPVNE